MASIAELEHYITVERTQAGLKAARARGRIGGRPPVPKKEIERALKLYETKGYTFPEIVEMTGVSKATLYRSLKKVDK